MDEALEAVCGVSLDAATTMICVDEIHNLNLGTRHGAEASDTLKYFAERIPATFVYAGIDIERAGLLNGPRGEHRGWLVGCDWRCVRGLDGAGSTKLRRPARGVWFLCLVHTGLTTTDEAHLFHQASAAAAISRWDRWKARRGVGDPLVAEIEAVVPVTDCSSTSHGLLTGCRCVVLKCGRQNKRGGWRAVTEVVLNAASDAASTRPRTRTKGKTGS